MKFKDTTKKRTFTVTIIVENESDTLAEGLKSAKKSIESLGVKVHDIKPSKSLRTLNQNNALHLLFKQLAEEMVEKGIDMKQVLKDGFDFPATPYNIKEFMWKPTQRLLFGKKSTTQLDKTEEINKVYDVVNKLLIERTNGEICLPPFPSLETLIDQQQSNY
jgi:DNA-directed RNA polymerase subunit F